MSESDTRSLREELEIRVVALLTGELPEADADELEKILSVDPELSAFRDRMAGLIGDVHAARDEIVPPVATQTMRLSDERRREIFGDVALDQEPEHQVKPKVNWPRYALRFAAVFVVLFFLSMMAIPSFQKVRSVSSVKTHEAYFEEPPVVEESYFGMNDFELTTAIPAERIEGTPAPVLMDQTWDHRSKRNVELQKQQQIFDGRDGQSAVLGDELSLRSDDYSVASGTIPAIEVADVSGPIVAHWGSVSSEGSDALSEVASMPTMPEPKAISELTLPGVSYGDVTYSAPSAASAPLSSGAKDMDGEIHDSYYAQSDIQSEWAVNAGSGGLISGGAGLSQPVGGVGSSRGPVDAFAPPSTSQLEALKDATESLSGRLSGYGVAEPVVRPGYEVAQAGERSNVRYVSEDEVVMNGGVDPFAAPAVSAQPPRRRVEIESKFLEVADSEMEDELGFAWKESGESSLSGKKMEKSKEVRESLQLGRSQYLNGEYDAATSTFSAVVAQEPNNAEAKLFQKRLSEIDKEGRVQKTREQLLTEVSQSWERPKVFDVDADDVDSVETEFVPVPRSSVIRMTGFRDSSSRSSGPVDPFAAPSSAASNGPSANDETDALKSFFQSAGVNFDGPGASLAFDGEQLIVSQSPRNLERIRTILDNYEEVKAAEVEAKFLEVTNSDLEEVGFDWSQVAADMKAPTISEKLDRIVIPQVNFSGMELSQVIETLSELSVEYDPEHIGVNIVPLFDVNQGNPRVNVSLRNLNVDRILEFVTQQVNYNYEVGENAVTVQPAVAMSGIEKYAEERANNTTQTPKTEKETRAVPISTFSLNVSDVSFKLAQAALATQRIPASSLIRTEEFVNSFSYGDPAPREDEPVTLNWEIAQHPYQHNRQIVRFSLQTQAAGRAADQALNLNLLIDNSGSMQRPDRRAILENSLQSLQSKLTDQDQLNIILFARQPRLIANASSVQSQQVAIHDALNYQPEGGTNLEAGLQAAYENAQAHYNPSASNRVILMTDGAANLGDVDASALAEKVVDQRKQGIALDAYGIGWEDYNDALLEEITRNGDGRYAFLNSIDSAADDFAEKLAGTLRVAAADVKVQIIWNPERVTTYRQIGYDLHQLKAQDFRDNTVDAAEIGEAESGTALYVLQIDEDPDIIGGLGKLQVRYRVPATGEYIERAWPLEIPRQIVALEDAPASLRLAATSALFAERLSENPYAANYSFEDLEALSTGLTEAFPTQSRVVELQNMIQSAQSLFTSF